jgi:hypothetical protein
VCVRHFALLAASGVSIEAEVLEIQSCRQSCIRTPKHQHPELRYVLKVGAHCVARGCCRVGSGILQTAKRSDRSCGHSYGTNAYAICIKRGLCLGEPERKNTNSPIMATIRTTTMPRLGQLPASVQGAFDVRWSPESGSLSDGSIVNCHYLMANHGHPRTRHLLHLHLIRSSSMTRVKDALQPPNFFCCHCSRFMQRRWQHCAMADGFAFYCTGSARNAS